MPFFLSGCCRSCRGERSTRSKGEQSLQDYHSFFNSYVNEISSIGSGTQKSQIAQRWPFTLSNQCLVSFKCSFCRTWVSDWLVKFSALFQPRPNLSVSCLLLFSRAWRRLPEISSNSDWITVLLHVSCDLSETQSVCIASFSVRFSALESWM